MLAVLVKIRAIQMEMQNQKIWAIQVEMQNQLFVLHTKSM